MNGFLFESTKDSNEATIFWLWVVKWGHRNIIQENSQDTFCENI